MTTDVNTSRSARGYGHTPHRHPRAVRSPEGPHGERLLAGYLTTGNGTDLREHLARYGRAPSFGEHRLIDVVERAGLTGRGGAGFPTATKMRAVATAGSRSRVVVANGMESEPASYKDKALLELAPHLVLDGIALAAEAVGATEAHLCVARSASGLDRHLYELVAERRGIDAIDIRIHTPPHHYVSSEASSLANWLGGGSAKPTTTPPRTAERGVAGLPTLVDNVETLAHLALIARYGPDWFRARGTDQAPGTALITLAGAFGAPGVYEVDYGTSLREILALGEASRGIQAVLVGGYFGSWLTIYQAAAAAFSPDGLAAAGAGPGAGVLAALPSNVCGLAETARILDYLAGQSARQCGPCRFGLPAVAEDFARLAFGHCDRESWERLQRRTGQLSGRGACKHPDGAAHLAGSALRAFAPHVRHHLETGPCTAAREASPLLPTPVNPIQDGDWR